MERGENHDEHQVCARTLCMLACARGDAIEVAACVCG